MQRKLAQGNNNKVGLGHKVKGGVLFSIGWRHGGEVQKAGQEMNMGSLVIGPRKSYRQERDFYRHSETIKLEKPSAVAVIISVLSTIFTKTSEICIWNK